MQFDDPALLAALRDTAPLETICRGAGISVEQFSAARDSYLRRRAALADQTITASVGGLVEIKRDRAGVPHIYADKHARSVLRSGRSDGAGSAVQMDRLRRRALGRQAEILGPGYVASDIAHRTVGIDQIADRDAAAMDDATRRIVDAFVGGINRQIAVARTALPIEFELLDYDPENFTVRDIVAIGRGIWWSTERTYRPAGRPRRSRACCRPMHCERSI